MFQLLFPVHLAEMTFLLWTTALRV